VSLKNEGVEWVEEDGEGRVAVGVSVNMVVKVAVALNGEGLEVYVGRDVPVLGSEALDEEDTEGERLSRVEALVLGVPDHCPVREGKPWLGVSSGDGVSGEEGERMEVMEGRLWLGREEGEVVRVAPHSITLGVTP